MVRRGRDKLDFLRQQRLHVRPVATGHDEFELDAGLFEVIFRPADIDRHIAEAFRRLGDLDLGEPLRAHNCRRADRGERCGADRKGAA